MQLELNVKDFLNPLKFLADRSLSYLLQVTGEFGENTVSLSLQLINLICLKGLRWDLTNAAKTQESLLKEILTFQKNTMYGEKYNFSNLQKSDSFRKDIPLSTYEDYRLIIDSLIKNNNYTQIVSEPINLFQETSGTTGKTKLIPRTSRLSLSFLKAFQATEAITESYFFKDKDLNSRRSLALINVVPPIFSPHGIPIGTGTSGGFNKAFQDFKLVRDLIRIKFSSPSDVFFISDYESAYYCHLLFGLLDENLACISANFASNVLEAIKILEKSWRQLVRDIELGTVNEKINLASNTRQILQSYLKPNTKRATKLKAEFEKGMQGIVPRIWNQMSCIQCITSGSMQVYQESLKDYVGTIPFNSAGYGASEAWIGVNLNPLEEPPSYVITPHSAFFEFIEVEQIETDDPTTVTLTSVEVGKSYEIVVTTVAGLYRYRLGDIVKCVGYYNQCPIVQFLYRQGSLLNIAGEKVSENTILTALTEAIAFIEEDCKIVDYTSRVEFSTFPAKYVIYLELSKNVEALPALKACKNKIEEVIFILNKIYKKCRNTNVIAPMELNLVKQGSFQELKKEVFRQTSESQFKMPKLLKLSEAIEFLESKILRKET